MTYDAQYSWRYEAGMVLAVRYVKKFAWIPRRCSDNERVWLKSYYSVYNTWHSDISGYDYSHAEFIENITQAEYIIRKLVGDH